MTYSIVARDADTGELGVAVQSHWFSVGPIVPWARTGLGAIATQANAEISFGPRGLELLDEGLSAPDVVSHLVGADPKRDHRQLAVVDARGEVAAYTGRCCMEHAGDAQGPGVSCQANIMASPQVWPAMLEAFDRTTGPLKTRLMGALNAAEDAGGDLRGQQSAAILIVPAAGDPWETVLSVRVDDHPDPLAELARLVRLDEAYRLADAADSEVAAGRHDEAAALFMRASELAPDSDELRFWAGLGAALVGRMDIGLEYVRAVIDAQPGWGVLLERLTPETAPAAGRVREALDSAS